MLKLFTNDRGNTGNVIGNEKLRGQFGTYINTRFY